MAITKLVSDSLGAGVGGSLIKLSSASASSGDASVSFNLSSSYNNYKLFGYKIRPATDAVEPYFAFSEDSGSTYLSTTFYSGRTYNRITNTSGSGAEFNAIAGKVQLATDLGNDGDGSCEFNLFNMNGNYSGANKFCNGTWTAKHNNDDYTWDNGFIIIGNNPINNMKIEFSAGNFTSGEFVLYGIKE